MVQTIEAKGPFQAASGYVCNKCKHPIVTNAVLIGKLGLTETNEDFSERTWERYLTEDQPVPLDHFRRVIANSFFLGWLSRVQAVSIWNQMDQFVAATSSVRALARRAAERKDVDEHQNLELVESELESELEKQLRLLDHETFDRINRQLGDPTLQSEVRQLLEDEKSERPARGIRQG